jgi:hypothetical protein
MSYNYKKTVRFSDEEYFNRYNRVKTVDNNSSSFNVNKAKSDFTVRRAPSMHDLISASDEHFKKFATSPISNSYTYKSDYILRRRAPSIHNLLSNDNLISTTVHYTPQINKTKFAEVQTDDSFLRDNFFKSESLFEISPPPLPSTVVYKTEVYVPSHATYVTQPEILYERKYEYKYHYSSEKIF